MTHKTNVNESQKDLCFTSESLTKEVIQLKDLLKESHDLVYELAFRLRKIPEIDKCKELRKKIREVLGEEYGFEKHTYYVRERSKDNDCFN